MSDYWLGYSDAPGERDALVPLALRGVFDRDLAFASGQVPRGASLVMVDIDHFKSVNDTHGHQTGDAVLVRVATTLREIVGRRGRCYRWGGEEFFALLPGFAEGEAAALAERIRAGIEALEFENGLPKSVTASFGVAEMTSDEDAKAFVKRVDNALYAAKAGGRNRVVASAGRYGLRPEARTRTTVLIVDDDKVIRRIVSELLGKEDGFDDVLTAENTFEAMNQGARDLTVAFVSLEMDGPESSSSPEIIRALRGRSPKARIYGMTSFGGPSRYADAVAAGADGIILKPFTVKEITRLARAACDGAPAPSLV